MADKATDAKTTDAKTEAVKPAATPDASVDGVAAGDDHRDGVSAGAVAEDNRVQAGVNQATGDRYDNMSLDDLRSYADERGVSINADVEKAHLVTELRAADSGAVSPATRKGAR